MISRKQISEFSKEIKESTHNMFLCVDEQILLLTRNTSLGIAGVSFAFLLVFITMDKPSTLINISSILFICCIPAQIFNVILCENFLFHGEKTFKHYRGTIFTPYVTIPLIISYLFFAFGFYLAVLNVSILAFAVVLGLTAYFYKINKIIVNNLDDIIEESKSKDLYK